MSRALDIWVVRDIEPLPSDASHPRLMRGGMVCEALAARGHKVTWFNSTFDHYSKSFRALPPGLHRMGNYDVHLLEGRGYARNVGLARVLHNRAFARSLMAHAQTAQRPDVLITDIPTTESAEAVVRLGQDWGRPSILSIRDLWPDFFVNALPAPLRPLARPAVGVLDRQARYACANATALLGISEDYLAWGLTKGNRQKRAHDAVSPLGYRPVPAKSSARERLAENGVDFSRALVSFVGAWGTTYDFDLLLATARALGNRSDIQMVIAGGGDQDAPIRAGLAGLSNVVAPGWLGASEIAALLDASTVGILPYRADAPQGLPNKVFEYMAYGVFQVSTLRGESEALLARHDLGLTATSREPAELARLVAEGVDGRSPQRRAAIKARFAAEYDAENIYARLGELAETLAGE